MRRSPASTVEPLPRADDAGCERPGPIDAPSRLPCDFEYFATVTATVRAEVIGDTPDGYRVNFYITSGTVSGTGIDAELRIGGVDWMTIRPDGIGVVDVGVTYETSDGALILEQSGGVLQLGAEQFAQVRAGVFAGSAPYYSSPQWRTSAPGWAWLNGQQGFGVGLVVLHESSIRSDIYLPRLGSVVGS
jgi:hypothetical protein